MCINRAFLANCLEQQILGRITHKSCLYSKDQYQPIILLNFSRVSKGWKHWEDRSTPFLQISHCWLLIFCEMPAFNYPYLYWLVSRWNDLTPQGIHVDSNQQFSLITSPYRKLLSYQVNPPSCPHITNGMNCSHSLQPVERLQYWNHAWHHDNACLIRWRLCQTTTWRQPAQDSFFPKDKEFFIPGSMSSTNLIFVT